MSKMKPSETDEGREKQLAALAYNLAAKKLEDGTASSQIISYFLNVGSPKEQLQKELLQKQIDLATAKTEDLKSNGELKSLYEDAIKAFRSYAPTEE